MEAEFSSIFHEETIVYETNDAEAQLEKCKQQLEIIKERPEGRADKALDIISKYFIILGGIGGTVSIISVIFTGNIYGLLINALRIGIGAELSLATKKGKLQKIIKNCNRCIRKLDNNKLRTNDKKDAAELEKTIRKIEDVRDEAQRCLNRIV